jgi:hypothetical protein
MVERDLMAARDKWLDDEKNEKRKAEMLESDFLCYCNHEGLFADFHNMRHLFITNLERAGILPKMAQVLARHSDIDCIEMLCTSNPASSIARRIVRLTSSAGSFPARVMK